MNEGKEKASQNKLWRTCLALLALATVIFIPRTRIERIGAFLLDLRDGRGTNATGSAVGIRVLALLAFAVVGAN